MFITILDFINDILAKRNKTIKSVYQGKYYVKGRGSIITKNSEIILIILLCQSCAIFCKTPDKPSTSAKLEPVVVETDFKSVKPSAATLTEFVQKDRDRVLEKKRDKKLSPIKQIEFLMRRREWREADKVVDEWNMKDLKVKRELKSHIGLVRGFLTGYDNCEQMESSSSRSKKEIVDCYVRLLENNWNSLPQRSYFSRDFAVHLTSKRTIVMKKLKRLRLAKDIEIIEEDIKKKAIKGRELEKLKKNSP